MDYPAHNTRSHSLVGPIAVLASGSRAVVGEIPPQVCDLAFEVLESSGAPREQLLTRRVGVFVAAGVGWSGREHVVLSQTFGLSGTAISLSQGAAGPSVAMHLATNAIRSRDVSFALVVGPARRTEPAGVAMMLLASANAAAEHGWHVRSLVLATAMGVVGPGRPPVEVAEELAGIAPEGNRFDTDMADLDALVRVHTRGGGPVRGFGAADESTAAHLVLGPPVHQRQVGLVPSFLGLSAESLPALRALVEAVVHDLQTGSDLRGMASDAGPRLRERHRLAVLVRHGPDGVSARLCAWLEGGHPDVWVGETGARSLTATRAHRLTPPTSGRSLSAVLSRAWVHGIDALQSSPLPLLGRAELPVRAWVPRRSPPSPNRAPDADLIGPTRPRSPDALQGSSGAVEVDVLEEAWELRESAIADPLPTCWVIGATDQVAATVRALEAAGVEAHPATADRVDAAIDLEGAPCVVVDLRSLTTQSVDDAWSGPLELALRLERVRTPVRLAMVTAGLLTGTHPGGIAVAAATAGAARALAAELPRRYLGHLDVREQDASRPERWVHLIGHPGSWALRDQVVLQRSLAPAPPATSASLVGARQPWILAGTIDEGLLLLGDHLVQRGVARIVLVPDSSGAPAASGSSVDAAIARRVRAWKRRGTLSAHLRASVRTEEGCRAVEAHLDGAQAGGVVLRVATAPQPLHDWAERPSAVSVPIAGVDGWEALAGTAPLAIWMDGRAPAPLPGAGSGTVLGAMLDARMRQRHWNGLPGAVVHAPLSGREDVPPVLQQLLANRIVGRWPTD